MNELSVLKIYKQAWRLFASRPWTVSGFVFLVYFVSQLIQTPLNILSDSLENGDPVAALVFAPILFVIFMLIRAYEQFFIWSFYLQSAKKPLPSYKEILAKWRDFQTIFRFLLAFLLQGIITFAPVLAGLLVGVVLFLATQSAPVFALLLLFIVALVAVSFAIILSLRLSFTLFFVIDKKYPPIKAVKNSFSLTKGELWFLFKFSAFALLINLLGFLALGVGVIISAIVTSLAWTYLYLKITEQDYKPAEKTSVKYAFGLYATLVSLIVLPLLIAVIVGSKEEEVNIPAGSDTYPVELEGLGNE